MEGDIKSYTAGAAIAPCRFVKVGSADNQVIQATSGAAAIFGITEQVVAAGGANAVSGDVWPINPLTNSKKRVSILLRQG